MLKSNKDVRKIIQKISEKIQKEYQPKKIILFGSYAWGRPDKNSDIDLFIVKKTKTRHIDRSVEVREILDEENGLFALDPIIYTPEELRQRIRIGDDFIKKIVTKGVVLYG